MILKSCCILHNSTATILVNERNGITIPLNMIPKDKILITVRYENDIYSINASCLNCIYSRKKKGTLVTIVNNSVLRLMPGDTFRW